MKKLLHKLEEEINNLKIKIPNVFKNLLLKDDYIVAKSYSQFGEDIIIKYIMDLMHIKQPRYIDVGAFHPIKLNNTYNLYRMGGSGLLIEPDPASAVLLKAKRSRDIVLNLAVKTKDMPDTIDFYLMSASSLNTAVKREAEHAENSQAWGKQKIKGSIKIEARTLNDICAEYFAYQEIDFIDIDVEGLDYELMREFDFQKFRPKLMMIEIWGGHYMEKNDMGTYHPSVKANDYIRHMQEHGYDLLLPVHLNGLFIRRDIIEEFHASYFET